jgi:hypothetical protein
VETSSREVSDAMTDSADCLAKPVLALRRRIPFCAGLALLARRVFDSFVDPSPMGVRGTAAASRQLVFEAGGYLIDLQIEQRKGGSGALAGQVVHAWTEGATRGAAVVLVREDSVIDQTIANSIGEFQFDGDYGDDVKICLGISDDTFIEVPLPDAGPEPSAARSAKEATNDNSEIGGRTSEKRRRGTKSDD